MGKFLWECWQKDLLLVRPRCLQISGANIWCKHLVRPRGLQTSNAPQQSRCFGQNQYLDFICIFVLVVPSLLENTIWEQ